MAHVHTHPLGPMGVMSGIASILSILTPVIMTVLNHILEDGGPKMPKHAPKPEEKPKPDWLPDGVNWAVCGGSGVGKSSFINGLRGLQPKDPGAAKVGVKETTTEPQAFTFPNSPVRLWDLPGCNTVKFPMSTYIDKFGLRFMAGLVIMTSTRATTAELEIMRLCEEYHIPWYYVRSKVDIDIENNFQDNGTEEEDTIAEIRADLISNMQHVQTKHTLSASRVYVLSSRGHKGDWKSFVTDLTADLKTTYGLD